MVVELLGGWAKLNVVFLCRQVQRQNTSFNFVKGWHFVYHFSVRLLSVVSSFRVSANLYILETNLRIANRFSRATRNFVSFFLSIKYILFCLQIVKWTFYLLNAFCTHMCIYFRCFTTYYNLPIFSSNYHTPLPNQKSKTKNQASIIQIHPTLLIELKLCVINSISSFQIPFSFSSSMRTLPDAWII